MGDMMDNPICPYCDEPMDYHGIDDGGGDYSDSACDQRECLYCDYAEEGDCLDFDTELADEPATYYQPVELPDDEPPQPYAPPARDFDDIPF